jgi:hypothetical protein
MGADQNLVNLLIFIRGNCFLKMGNDSAVMVALPV